MKKQDFGILMSAISIGGGTYVFKPVNIIQGVVEETDYDEVKEKIFIDGNSGIEYSIVDNPGFPEFSDFGVVGYTITLAALKAKYPEMSLEEAKIEYFESFYRNVNIGTYNVDEDRFQLLLFDLDSLVESANNLKKSVDINSKIDVNVSANKKEEEKQVIKKDLNVTEMKAFFDKIIIGQEEAKKDVISAVKMNSLSNNSSDRNNCLLIGPTGSGKTLIAETASKYLDIPMVIIDTTQLTITGYVGSPLEDFIVRLIDAAKGDVAKAQNGIVVFDEIDKKNQSGSEDLIGKGALNSLLPFIQGTIYDVPIGYMRSVKFDTSKLTIFATGAFTEVATNVKSSLYSNDKIGFNSNGIKEEKEEDIKYNKITTEDLVKYGNMPIELIGRFSTICQLIGQTIESLKRILTSSEKSVLLSEKEKLKKLNIELEWTEAYLDNIAKEAMKLKTGARSLKSAVERSIKEVRWTALNNLDLYSKIILTENSALDNNDCILVDKNNNSHNLKDLQNNQETAKIKKLER